jgi:hypothetical protein
MKLEEIKGKKALEIMAEAMELAEQIRGDPRFGKMAEAISDAKQGGRLSDADAVRILFRHLPPLIRDERYADGIVRIMALAAGVPEAEYAEDGPILQDIVELLSSDAEALGFLAGSATRAE